MKRVLIVISFAMGFSLSQPAKSTYGPPSDVIWETSTKIKVQAACELYSLGLLSRQNVSKYFSLIKISPNDRVVRTLSEFYENGVFGSIKEEYITNCPFESLF